MRENRWKRGWIKGGGEEGCESLSLSLSLLAAPVKDQLLQYLDEVRSGWEYWAK